MYNYKINNKTKVLVIVGENEPDPWINLSKDITKWLSQNNIKYNFLLAKNLNHFTMVKALARINSEVSKSTIAMVQNQ